MNCLPGRRSFRVFDFGGTAVRDLEGIAPEQTAA